MSKEIVQQLALSPGANLEAYVQAVNGIAMLSVEEERALAQQLFQEGDLDSARL